MSFEVGKRALDFLVANSGSRRNLDIDFFGGEPLMNFEVVKQLVEYGRSIEKEHGKNMRFTITTNGLLLNDEIIDYINENMHNVVLSLDGRKAVNDNMRMTINDKGSYDVIVPKMQKLVEKRPKDKYYYVRGTFTRENLDLHGKNMRFTITTNGLLLNDEIIDYINENMHNVVLSLDGRKAVNDNMRMTINDKGSYDVIVPKMQKLVEKRPKDKYYYVRGTFTRENLDFSKDILHFRDLGFELTSVEPVVDDERLTTDI